MLYLLMLTHLRFKPATIVVTSELPLGSGLGSSVALCVAFSAALFACSDSFSFPFNCFFQAVWALPILIEKLQNQNSVQEEHLHYTFFKFSTKSIVIYQQLQGGKTKWSVTYKHW